MSAQAATIGTDETPNSPGKPNSPYALVRGTIRRGTWKEPHGDFGDDAQVPKIDAPWVPEGTQVAWRLDDYSAASIIAQGTYLITVALETGSLRGGRVIVCERTHPKLGDSVEHSLARTEYRGSVLHLIPYRETWTPREVAGASKEGSKATKAAESVEPESYPIEQSPYRPTHVVLGVHRRFFDRL